MIKDSELDKMTLKQLSDLQQRVDRMIETKGDEQRNQLRDRFKQMAEQAGLTLGDIVGIPRAAKGRGKAKVAAKYANPDDTSQTWSGRGRMPKWLTAKLKSGAKVADFKL